MKAQITVPGRRVVALVSANPNGIGLKRLAATVAKRFGSSAKFKTGKLPDMDLEDLLVFLEVRDKVRIVRGMVFPCSSPAYAH